jgi:FlaA1/EpsC-like NDP-sugar epimerase
MLEGRVVLVSGAGGSIGSELCRLIARWRPKKLILLEFSEFALYEIHRELEARNGVEIVPALGSVTDATLVDQLLAEHAVEIVFHAAAHKHVPLVEANPIEGVRNNVFGTKVMTEASLAAGVEHFVLISTDKAVHPTSVMGASKWWAELIVQGIGEKAAEAGKGQKFCAVRFGNVLGSNGSVVPLFKEQIAHGGPVTLTNERMTRYFMSIHEAGELIIQAGALSEGGDTFMLEMGEPVAIRSLAENMVRLAGLSVRDEKNPGGDIEITVTGARQGEKLREELFYDPALVEKTSQQKILRARHSQIDEAAFARGLKRLEKTLDRRDEAELRSVLFSLSESAAATPAPTSPSQSPVEERTL